MTLFIDGETEDEILLFDKTTIAINLIEDIKVLQEQIHIMKECANCQHGIYRDNGSLDCEYHEKKAYECVQKQKYIYWELME